MAIATHIVHKTLNPIFNRKYETGKFKRLYLERPNNQNQSEISKYKPLIVNTF